MASLALHPEDLMPDLLVLSVCAPSYIGVYMFLAYIPIITSPSC